MIIAVIPARGGSKGVPRKNLRPAGGKPLVAWSIEAAREASLVERVYVSTEDQEIASLARTYGAEVIERPTHLATDEALTDPVLVHAAEATGAAVVVTLQPTVPVRAPGLVDACLTRFLLQGADSLLTLSPLHFVWWREEEYVEKAGPAPETWRSQCPRRPRRQDMTARERMFAEDGSVYVCTRDLLLRTGSRLGGKVEAYETERSIDIDTWEDLELADAMLWARARRERAVVA